MGGRLRGVVQMRSIHLGWLGLGGWLLSACSGSVGTEIEVGEASPVELQGEALTNNALTAKEAKTALRLIDDICGDTWCDGDYDFGFRRLVCNRAAKTCTLTLQVFSARRRGEHPTQLLAVVQDPRFCRLCLAREHRTERLSIADGRLLRQAHRVHLARRRQLAAVTKRGGGGVPQIDSKMPKLWRARAA